jgi:hypothetical protein
MSPSSEIPKRRLVADTGTPTTEIVVINAEGDIVAQATTRISTELPIGIYKLRFRIGNRIIDQLYELPAGQGEYEVVPPDMPLDSPAPLGLPTQVTGEPANLARDWSRSPALKVGAGSGLFLFIDARHANGIHSGPELRAFSGEKIQDLATSSNSQDGCVGCHLELDPGSYLLRAGEIEQTVVTCANWQTQVFIPMVKNGNNWQPELNEAAILMSRLGAGFDPTAPDLRWTEAARQSLAARRAMAASSDLMQSLLMGKFKDPILGVFAAHLCILQKSTDVGILREVVTNLERLIPGHPDVTSLLYSVNDPRAAGLRYPEPPMLRSSWLLIVQNRSGNSDARPAHSYSARIAGSLWGSGAWLSWKMPPPVEALDVTPSEAPADLKTIVNLAYSGKLPQYVATRTDLTPIERILLTYAQNAGGQLNTANDFSAIIDGEKRFGFAYPFIRLLRDSELQRNTKDHVYKSFSPDELASMTGIPVSSLAEAASSLTSKLGLREKSRISEAVAGATESVSAVATKLTSWLR